MRPPPTCPHYPESFILGIMSDRIAKNLMLQEIQYQVEETTWGTWRRFVYPTGNRFAEFESRIHWGRMPLLHYTFGICPETGKRITAHGIIAVGRFAHGFIAVGQVSVGLVAIGQLAIGLVFGLGQAATGAICIGQLAVSMIFAFGQIGIGKIAIGQIVYGQYVLGQLGWGDHVWDTRTVDPIAQDFFLKLIGR
jgi:hypothetical protein